jgi:hypothetical protein
MLLGVCVCFSFVDMHGVVDIFPTLHHSFASCLALPLSFFVTKKACGKSISSVLRNAFDIRTPTYRKRISGVETFTWEDSWTNHR